MVIKYMGIYEMRLNGLYDIYDTGDKNKQHNFIYNKKYFQSIYSYTDQDCNHQS